MYRMLSPARFVTKRSLTMRKLLIVTTLLLSSTVFADCECSCGCECGNFVDGVIYTEDKCPQIEYLPDAEIIEEAEPCPAPEVVKTPEPLPSLEPCDEGCGSDR